MIAYTIIFFMRLVIDIAGTSRIAIMHLVELLQLSRTKFAFSILMLGIRPFTFMLFPCENVDFRSMNGYCPDRMMIGDEPFNPLDTYICIVRVSISYL